MDIKLIFPEGVFIIKNKSTKQCDKFKIWFKSMMNIKGAKNIFESVDDIDFDNECFEINVFKDEVMSKFIVYKKQLTVKFYK